MRQSLSRSESQCPCPTALATPQHAAALDNLDASVKQAAVVASLTACAHLRSNNRVSPCSPNSQWRSPMRSRLSPVSQRSSPERGLSRSPKSTMSMSKYLNLQLLRLQGPAKFLQSLMFLQLRTTPIMRSPKFPG